MTSKRWMPPWPIIWPTQGPIPHLNGPLRTELRTSALRTRLSM